MQVNCGTLRSTPLLGRDLMRLFDLVITDECPTQVDNVKELDLDLLIKEYDVLFKDELWCYKYEKVDPEIDPLAKPVFVKPRVVSFALKEMINQELDKLEKEGVIVQVENSE